MVWRKGAGHNISLVTDLPLFIDPFLLFNSKKQKYRELHDEIIKYLVFLRDRAIAGETNDGLLKAWYQFSEVRQNWLGFTKTGNRGSGLGRDFAIALRENLNNLFPDFGEERRKRLTKGTHLEKLCLVREGVGRDNISDFATNLIKSYLCEYTEDFAKEHIATAQRRVVAVPRARFNYETETWEAARYELPFVRGDYVLLTPKDLLTKDDTWINRGDLIRSFEDIPDAIPDDALRAQINNYFNAVIAKHKDKGPSQKERAEAARRTLLQYPDLVDYYIRLKEQTGDHAESISAEKVRLSERVFFQQIRELQSALWNQTLFYRSAGNTFDEALERLHFLKDLVENKGCHKIFYMNGAPIQREDDLHVMYRLVWIGTESDVSREVDDGKGPADFKISRGAKDKTIVEFKLAKNTSLEKNLKKQAELYQAASDARHSIKAIMFFSEAEEVRVNKILDRLGLLGKENIVLIDARADNKPSASKA